MSSHLIKTLLKGFQSKDIFTDEAQVDFKAKKTSSYEKFGSHPYGPYQYGPYDSTGDYYNNGMNNHGNQ